jgi:hypothetical protein
MGEGGIDSPLTLALVGGEWSVSCPCHFTPGERGTCETSFTQHNLLLKILLKPNLKVALFNEKTNPTIIKRDVKHLILIYLTVTVICALIHNCHFHRRVSFNNLTINY